MLVMIEDSYTVGNGIINSFELLDLSATRQTDRFPGFECRNAPRRGLRPPSANLPMRAACSDQAEDHHLACTACLLFVEAMLLQLAATHTESAALMAVLEQIAAIVR
jgi:hypothetical protein